MTTYRLTEHYLSGAMSRWLPVLAELQPELFIEISPELAQEKGIKNLDWVRISTPRSQMRAKALVTRRAASASDRWQNHPSGRHAVALGIRRPRHGRCRQRAHGARRRSQRHDPRREGVRLQHRKGVEGSMPEPMGFYTDTTVCIGCKACEVACKEWNQLPSDQRRREHAERRQLRQHAPARRDALAPRQVHRAVHARIARTADGC